MKRITKIGCLVALISICGTAAIVSAGNHQDTEGPQPATGQKMRGQTHQKHEQMRVQDARLEELVTAMNSAEGTAKIDAIAAVVWC